MGFVCGDCGGTEYSCTAWDGNGAHYVGGNLTNPNHNLVESCPTKIKTCSYRKKKMPSKPITVAP